MISDNLDFASIREEFSDMHFLLLPGWKGGSAEHWMFRWEDKISNMKRVIQDGWDNPQMDLWVDRLQATVQQAALSTNKPIILVAHSMGCLLAAQWALQWSHDDAILGDTPVKGALLVAPPDPRSEPFPEFVLGFHDIDHDRFPFPTTVIASTTDEYASEEYAQTLANTWGSEFVSVGPQGHINADSNLGDWPAGLKHLESLVVKVREALRKEAEQDEAGNAYQSREQAAIAWL